MGRALSFCLTMVTGLVLALCGGCGWTPGDLPPWGSGAGQALPTANSGCLDVADTGKPQTFSAAETIELTVDGSELLVVHRNATYNCCAGPDEIVVALAVDGSTLRLTETASVANPCFCTCPVEVETTVSDLEPGTYTVEFYWQDPWGQENRDTQAVVIP